MHKLINCKLYSISSCTELRNISPSLVQPVASRGASKQQRPLSRRNTGILPAILQLALLAQFFITHKNIYSLKLLL